MYTQEYDGFADVPQVAPLNVMPSDGMLRPASRSKRPPLENSGAATT
ncbi:hypothetical protein [Mycobacterium servetii]|uniref:Uncharacterized protein n=1 Tax=Mycobacterium servetii TaxID=3237418 RepID=A0ABV4BYI8_9MYCO